MGTNNNYFKKIEKKLGGRHLATHVALLGTELWFAWMYTCTVPVLKDFHSPGWLQQDKEASLTLLILTVLLRKWLEQYKQETVRKLEHLPRRLLDIL